MSTEIVRYPDLRPRFGIDYSFEHLCRMSAAGTFPAKVKLSHRCVGWVASEIEAWLAARMAQRPESPKAA